MMQIGPVMVGTLLIDAHIFSVWLFSIIGSLNSIHSHGGYNFPCMPLTDFHRIHHNKILSNYGTGPLDKIHGTVNQDEEHED